MTTHLIPDKKGDNMPTCAKRDGGQRMTAYEALLELLGKAPAGGRVTSTDVNELVGEELSRQATHQAALRLRQQGYILTGNRQEGGYRLLGREGGHGVGNR